MTRTHSLVLILLVPLLAPGALAQVDPAPPYEERVVEVDGASLRYLDFGGEGLPVIFTPAMVLAGEEYVEIATRLSDDYRVLVVGRRDEGGPVQWLGTPTHAKDLLGFLDALGIERAVLAGNTDPAYRMTYLAEEHPGRVAGVIYLAGPPSASGDLYKDPESGGPMLMRLWGVGDGFLEEEPYPFRYREDEEVEIPVPALTFVNPEGIRGTETQPVPLLYVGSPRAADDIAAIEHSADPAFRYFVQVFEDEAFRDEQLAGIPDLEVRTYFEQLATDESMQAEVERFYTEKVAPAELANWAAFKRAFGEHLRVVELDVPVVSGYEYKNAPELIEPHIRRFLQEVRRREAASEVPTYTIDQFMETVRISTASLSADGEKVLFTSDASGVPNAWAVPFAGGEPIQLTHSADPIHTHGYFPDDERLIYSADEGGNERTHIFVRSPDGSVRDLTPGEDVRAMFLGWSADGRGFFFASNERDPRRMDVYEMSLDGYERTLLYRNDRGARVGAISPDRRLLGFVRLNSNHDNDLFLYDRRTGQETLLSSRDHEALSFPHGFGSDGRHLYYTTDRDSDFRYLVRYDVETGEHQTVLRPEWDVTNVALSPAGRYVAAAVNVDARTQMHLLEAATLEPVPLPSLPTGDITAIAFSRDERRLAFPVGSGRSPGDLYVLDLDEGEPRLLVRTLSPEIDPEHLVEPEVVRFASYDGLEIPGLLYQPHAASPDTPVPAMIWIHGGPGGQSRIGYDPLIQYLVNHGYAVYAINNRGSSGYGKNFEALDDRKHGEVDLEDVVASKQMLIDTGWVDPERIGVMGASYGGYLTMAALTFRPETFAVGVNIYGVTNWIRSLEARDGARPWMQSGQKSIFAELGDPATDRDRLHRISPLFHADRITKPFLVLQGANDQRVLQVESDEIVAAALANGVPVEYIVFPDEGHGFRKKENQRRAYQAVLEFLDQHLRGDGP